MLLGAESRLASPLAKGAARFGHANGEPRLKAFYVPSSLSLWYNLGMIGPQGERPTTSWRNTLMTATKQSAGGNGAGEATALPTQAANSDQASGHPMLELQRELIIGIGRIQHEYATFVGKRVRKNIDTTNRMAECRDIKVALELQRNYVENAREDYIEEAARLLSMGQTLSKTCVQRLADVSSNLNWTQDPQPLPPRHTRYGDIWKFFLDPENWNGRTISF